MHLNESLTTTPNGFLNKHLKDYKQDEYNANIPIDIF